ncbi:hypothetical protein [Agromyces archimandritae]|uniref:Uncharacterized protein n=1 Tax=Agromyces archimandritae TaxID=2781962 RepID=A0A975FL78_9MICO|nr:hypothetical protein [Agromyces archimandritae]QTX04548.1 hypothetical protein G127AT_15005 [Agromyces archimandritae]
MTDADTAAPPADTGAPTPPWGDDFDAARAWQTITALRDEVRALKAATATTREELAAATAARDDLEAAHAATSADLWRERSLRRHPHLADVADLLTGADEAAVAAVADRLAALAPAAPDATASPLRPVPGHALGPTAPAPDYAAIAARVQRR